MKILFVCNANMVRSYMAERVLKRLLARRGRVDVEVASAGLLDMNASPADPAARRVLEEQGIDGQGHLSRPLTEEMVAEADLIVAMERRQLELIGQRYPQAAGKVRLLKSYLPSRGVDDDPDLKDPYRLSPFHYRLALAEISLAMEELLKCI